MGATVFTGPILAGSVLQSDGSGNLAGVGGSSGQANVGFVSMAQAAPITQSTVATPSGIVIPANSIIHNILLLITTGWGSSGTLSIGTSTTSTELAAAIANASLVQGKYVVPVTSLIGAWLQSSATSDVAIYTKSSAGTAGVATLVVEYLQAINGFTAGSYT